MRLVTYEVSSAAGSVRRTGALTEGDDVIDLANACAVMASGAPRGAVEVPVDMLELLRGGERVLEAARGGFAFALAAGVDKQVDRPVRFPAGSFRLLAPLPRPNSIRQFSLIEAHLLAAIETMARKVKVGGNRPALTHIVPEWYQIPAYFKSSVEEVYGPGDAVPWPAYTAMMDYELELAAVIGQRGRGIKAHEASSYIVGFTLFNDWSGRDIQQQEMNVNLGPGICKDFASSIGPCIITRDEFDRDSASLTATVDGELWTDSKLGMRITFEEVIEAISQENTLMPGDVLTSGTVSGGCGIEHDKWLKEGAEVILSATGIGSIANTVGRRGAGAPLPASQRDYSMHWSAT